jgi:serine protease Do
MKKITKLLISLLLLASCNIIDIPREAAEHVVPWKSITHNNRTLATGFHVTYFGVTYIMTNRHVCESNRKLYGDIIVFGDDVEKIIAIDPVHDLCIVSSSRQIGLLLAKETSMPLDKIYLVGYPRGIGKVIREGRIIKEKPLFAMWMGFKWVTSTQISAPAYRGNSGSPVLNELGEVTGVLFAGSPAYPLEPYIVPLRYVKAFINEAIYGIQRPEHVQQ